MIDGTQEFGVEQITDGTQVYDSAGEKLGSVVDRDLTTDYLTVKKGWFFPKDTYVPISAIARVDADGVLLNLTKEELQDDRYAEMPGETFRDTATVTVLGEDEREIRVPVREEELIVGTQRQQAGRAHLHKEVLEERQTVSVPLQREQLVVERVAVSGTEVDVNSADIFVEREIEIALMGEEVVVDKRTKLVEEVRLRKDVITENEQVSESVRKERVVVDGDIVDERRVR